MEPYKAKKLPFAYETNSELLKLLCDTEEIYGEYRGFLKNMSYDYRHFLECLFVSELYYSFKIDGFKIEKDNMFYMPYMIKNNDVVEFENLKNIFSIIANELSNDQFSLDLINKINKTLFSNCHKNNQTKGSGKLRKVQNYLLKPGLAGASVSFVPPLYTELNDLMKNLVQYMNNNSDVPFFATSIAHFQFEKLHPYVSGNGKIGRLLIPLQFSFYKKEPPILFLSESIYNLKNTYFTLLSGEVENDITVFIKYMLQSVIEQCNLNIKKIKKLNKIYNNDIKEFKDKIGGTTIFKVYPAILKKIVFTTNDIVTECNLHINSVNKVLNKLVDQGYLVKLKKKGTNRVTFCYKRMFDVFTN